MKTIDDVQALLQGQDYVCGRALATVVGFTIGAANM